MGEISLDGILPLWKEKGMTSHDCVFQLRKILKMKKIGHTGTLDPNVDGVLPICLGQATKLAEYITDEGKTYEAKVSIGRATTTEDAEGETVEEDFSFKTITKEQIEKVLQALTGEIEQTPPMYSAVKVNGKKLYEYARSGQTVERPTRKVTIYSLDLLNDDEIFQGEEITFSIRISCSKGTYIRTLAVQIGEALGYPAHMAQLTRTRSGNFTKEQCYTLKQIQEFQEKGTVQQIVLPKEFALSKFPFIESGELEKQILNGQVLPQHSLLTEHEKIVFTKQNKAIAVYIQHPSKKGWMKPEKIFQI